MTNTSESKATEDITCTVYSSFEDIVGMQEEWDSFVESIRGDIYFTFDWCRIWFSRLGPKLPFKRWPLWKLWIRTRL